jgi:ribosome maturation protein Sdo1
LRVDKLYKLPLKLSACIKQIQDNTKLPIQRARMRLRVTLPASTDETMRQKVLHGVDKVEEERITDSDWQAVRHSTYMEGDLKINCSQIAGYTC